MENDLSVAHYVGVIILTMVIISIPIITIFILIPYWNDSSNDLNFELTKTENILITSKNYNDIYSIVDSSTDITLQEKANFRKNFFMFGKSCIGYKVKELLKEIKY